MNSWHPENTLFSGQMCSDEGQVLGARFTNNTCLDPKRTLNRRAGVGRLNGVGGSSRHQGLGQRNVSHIFICTVKLLLLKQNYLRLTTFTVVHQHKVFLKTFQVLDKKKYVDTKTKTHLPMCTCTYLVILM